jgi:Tfp pilus assembly pilus retraction ATPase PilT
MEIRVDSETIAGARDYSDWRLYDTGVEQTCALPAQHKAGQGTQAPELVRAGTVQEVDRPWHEYDQLSVQLKRLGDQLLQTCRGVSRTDPYAAFLIDLLDERNTRGTRFRVQGMGGFFAVKHIPLRPIALDSLHGMNPAARRLALSLKLKNEGGLLLCVGDTGAGKSTGANAVVRERLLQYGGYALVLADPLETPLGDDGGHRVGEQGYVDEVDVSSIGYKTALEHALRAFPIGTSGILYYGEIRSDSNSVDLLNIACDGHEVISTVHGMTADAAISRLVASSARAGMPISIARELLAQSLRGVLFHRYMYGTWRIEAYEATDRVLQGIREGLPAPFKTAATQYGPLGRASS